MITQTPWFERKFDFNFPVGVFPVIIERLRGTIPQLEAMLKNIPEKKLSPKDGDHWSIKEQVGHLYDLEELWYGRIEDFLSYKETLRAADLSNTKTEQANHNAQTIDELLKQFFNARNKLLLKVENIDEATASITALHPRLQQPMRLIDSLFFVAEHDDHHLAKIRQLLNE
ncbi:MAG: DinB family protein [Chitinophagales bacterium]